MRNILKILVLIGLVICGKSIQVLAQYKFSDTPLVVVLEELNSDGNYILLYRESLIKGVSVTLTASKENVFELLAEELRRYNLSLLLDSAQKQVVIFRTKTPEPESSFLLKGYIIDDYSGERLPFATLSWETDSGVTGVAANQAGFYVAEFSTIKPLLLLKVSYIGYEDKILEFTLEELRSFEELPIRLIPVITNAKEVIVTGFRQFSDNHTVQKTVEITSGTLLGETNTYKSLQQLPSITISPALSEGVHVRGSPADGFQVLLDGVTIYSQTHLFGLFDNFNAAALSTSGLYYDITPASYQAPIGGTLALITRTGSVNEHRVGLGVSNTSLNATIEGPLSKGKASFLLSGRTSFIDQINWFGNDDLINWGLDVDRPSDFFTGDNVNIRTNVVRALNSDASFGDLHAKLNMETISGNRFMLSGYFGFDDISVDAERLFRNFRADQGSQIKYEPVKSENRWSNGKVSGHIQQRLGKNIFNNTTLGWSVFDTHFSKDDYTYTRINPGTGFLESFITGIEIKSIINELMVQEDVEWVNQKIRVNGGLSYRYFKGEYFEDSFERPAYFKASNAHKMDAWLHSELNLLEKILFSGGIRTDFYSEGNYFNISPRVKSYFFPKAILSASAGYSRNFQYINRVSFSNVLSSDVWVLVDKEQPPVYVDQFTAGVYFDQQSVTAQLEGYYKVYEHLRLHEIETYSIINAFNASPWFSDNSGIGKGIEFMLINKYNRFEFNQSLTLSSMEIRNAEINNGIAFLADWNRTWQYSGIMKVNWGKGFESTITQVYATGTPNKLSIYGIQEREQLDSYYRADVNISYTGKIREANITASIVLYNLFNKKNPWYREIGFGIDESSEGARFVSFPVQVYDLSFQPSFSLAIRF